MGIVNWKSLDFKMFLILFIFIYVFMCSITSRLFKKNKLKSLVTFFLNEYSDHW